jgi:hypothetical protein
MIENYKPSREDVKLFLNRITERVRLNNKKQWKSHIFKAKL